MSQHTHHNRRDDLSDIVFIQVPASAVSGFGNSGIDPEKPLPVQVVGNTASRPFDPSEGISVEMIAAGMIRLLAYKPDHPDIPYYRQILPLLQPDVHTELSLAGIAKARKQEYAFAEELLLASCHLDPMQAQSYVNLAVLYAQQAKDALDKHDDATYDYFIEKQLGILREGLSHLPLSDLLLCETGLLHLFLGNREEAVEHLAQYVRIAPESERRSLIEAKLGEVSAQLDDDQTLYAAYDEMQLGNSEQALRLVTTFTAHQPKSWSGWFVQGWAHRRLGNFADAQKAFLTCLELGERNADIYNELSICALELGQPELATQYLDIALEFEPDNVKLLTNLAFLHIRDGRHNEAYRNLLRARQIDPEDPAVKHLASQLDPRGTSAELDDEEAFGLQEHDSDEAQTWEDMPDGFGDDVLDEPEDSDVQD